MKENLYKLPLQLGKFFNRNDAKLDKCSLLESIDQHIELLLCTCPGEHAFNYEYGTYIWEMDFERVLSRVDWEQRFGVFIKQAIDKNEKRISDIRVKVVIQEVVRDDVVFDAVAIRKRVDVYVYALLNETNQKCTFTYKLYLGPLSNE